MIYSKFFKRLLSIVFSLIVLIITLPITLVVALLVRIKLGSPIFFVQERTGYKEKSFKLMKFRTMTDARDENGNLLRDRDRKTKFGNFLRKTSLDELPGMLNVLKGDMSIIGPRPLKPAYLMLYSEEQRKRHNVRPGFTCLAAVKGRNILPWVESLKLDTYYAENVSFFMDFRIAIETVPVVMFGKGAPDASETSRESIYTALQRENHLDDEVVAEAMSAAHVPGKTKVSETADE